MNEDRFFKTVRGEVYVKCGIEFGPEPVLVDGRTLNIVSGRAGLDRTIGEWLASDKRLVEVPNPTKRPDSEALNETEKSGKSVKAK